MNRRTIAAILLSASLGALTACEPVGVLASRGVDPTVKAKYSPNKKENMLVFVESYGLSLDSGIEAQHLTISLRKAIEDSKIAPLVDQKNLENLRDTNPEQYGPMTIADIGRRTGAAQVLYVNIWRAEVVKPTGSGQLRGHMDAIVKIVDSTTGDTRWPTGAPSEAVQITTNWFPDSEKSETDVRAQMADDMAEDIGKLFHDWHPDVNPPPDSAKVNVDGG